MSPATGIQRRRSAALGVTLFKATLAAENPTAIHAGHGLTYDNVKPVAAIVHVRELNIGHFLIGEAIFVGLIDAIQKMRRLMDDARA